MREFLKYLLASTAGFLLAGFLLLSLGLAAVGGVLMSEQAEPTVKPGTLLHIALNGRMEERSTDNPIGSLLGEDFTTFGLEQTLTAIERAQHDERIAGILLTAGALTNATPAMLAELRQTLTDFREASGKPIVAYGDHYTQGCYYVCSVADPVLLNPQGTIHWCGLSAQPIFYKDLLKKVGVEMQVFRVGTYKSAVEPFTSTEMSPANREQVNAYLNDIWQQMLDETARSRRLSPQQLDAYADRMLLFETAEDLVRLHMADSLCYRDEVKRFLKRTAGIDGDSKLNLLTVSEATRLPADTRTNKHEVAVYYAYGDIVDNDGAEALNSACINSSIVCRDLQQLRTDENVKAVVLRINSGGGSAYASEQLWREIGLLQQEKPVVVSMGGMAASGGYYMACAAGTLMAEPTTLTGSIGIFGMIPDCSELLKEKLGLTFDAVKTNRMADFGTPSRPFNEQERALMQAYIERGYALFVKRVAEGRALDIQRVEELAGGRVWTGNQALANGLVDTTGYLSDAIATAARIGHLTDYAVKHYPATGAWYENLLDKQRRSYLESEMRQALGPYHEGIRLLQTLNRQSCIQARLPYTPNITP